MDTYNNILIADDHPLFRMGVKTLIDNLEGYHVIGEANNGTEAIQILSEQKVDIAILDIDMPEKNGIEVEKSIQGQDLQIKIIFLTSHSDLTLFKQAYESNFSGFLFKESALDELEQCFNEISSGATFISPVTKRYITENKEDLERIKQLNAWLDKLTKSEKKVLLRIIQRKTTKEIAEELFNSYKTIENHRLNICHKLNIKGTNNLLSFAINNQDDIKQIIGEPEQDND